jgi:hypothetical protein
MPSTTREAAKIVSGTQYLVTSASARERMGDRRGDVRPAEGVTSALGTDREELVLMAPLP